MFLITIGGRTAGARRDAPSRLFVSSWTCRVTAPRLRPAVCSTAELQAGRCARISEFRRPRVTSTCHRYHVHVSHVSRPRVTGVTSTCHTCRVHVSQVSRPRVTRVASTCHRCRPSSPPPPTALSMCAERRHSPLDARQRSGRSRSRCACCPRGSRFPVHVARSRTCAVSTWHTFTPARCPRGRFAQTATRW